MIDNLIKDYLRALKEYRSFPEDARLSKQGKAMYNKIASLKADIDRVYRRIPQINTPVGNYKTDLS